MYAAEVVHPTGHLKLEVFDAQGNLLSTHHGHNLIVNVGKALLAGLLSGETVRPQYIALGTDNTAAAAAQTALIAEITTGGGERKIGAADRFTTSVTNDTFRLQATFTFTASFAIVEAGLFDDPGAGTMTARKVFAAVNVVNGNVVVATWTIQY